MDVLYPRCAGLDVHKDTVVAGVRLAGDGPVRTEVRTFDTTTPGLLALSAWLAEQCQIASKSDPFLECAPAGGQFGRFELTPLAGLPEDGSHDEAPVPQRSLQAAGR